MIKKLKTLITGSIGLFNKGDAILLALKVCNAQTNKINELIDKINELEKKLESNID